MHASNPKSGGDGLLTGSVVLLVSVCFLLSGLAGLVYEVVWARQLGLFLGITSYAHTAVITAYMAGLAAGSLYFGRRADRHPQPLRLYAWLEIGVGVYAAITPWLFDFLQTVYVNVTDVSQIGLTAGHLTRFAIALLALLLPTFLMGGTLPLLVKGFVTELPGLGKVTGRLYGINTMGAMSGTLLAGYLLLPGIGVSATIFVGVAINLGVAIIILMMLRRFRQTPAPSGPIRSPGQPAQTVANDAMTPRLRYMLLGGFGSAGFAALLTQMAWIRALILVVGGSVYAFTITLASFLAGIGLGSLLYTRYLANLRGRLAKSWLHSRMVQASILCVLIGLTLLLGLPLIGRLPEWLLMAYAAGLQDNFRLFQLFIFVLSFGLMILPTLFMGVLFPLVTVIWTRGVGATGRGVGAAYAINTSGTILGAMLGGLFILPWLGVHDSIILAAGIYWLVGLAFWLHAGVNLGRWQQTATTVVTALVFMSIAWSVPPWDKALMVSGVFMAPDTYIQQMKGRSLAQVAGQNALLYYAEGRDGVVAVRLHQDNKALVINGKTDASSSLDLPTQILLAQLPLSLDRKPESALVIGLGSGITAGTLATNESIRDLTILEISDEVVEASALFVTENYGVLMNPKVNLVTADARNFMMASSKNYDLIISEPSNPWITGISNLFTDEFFKLAKSHLNPGGVMTQWFHTYGMTNADLKTVLNTFNKNFNHVSVWSPLFEDIVIVGSDQPHAISLDHGQVAGAQTRARELSRGNVNSDRDLVMTYLFGGEILSRYVRGAKINSDNRPVIEFSAPRNLYASTTQQNMADIFEFLEGRYEPAPVVGMVRQGGDELDAGFMGLKIAIDAGKRVSGVAPQWLIGQLLLEENGTKTYGVVGSERLLTWQEGPARFQIQASWSATEPSRQDLPRFLNQTNRKDLETGMMNLPGDVDAIWAIRGNASLTELLIDMNWYCRARPTGYTLFVARISQPYVEQAAWRDALSDFTNRLACEP